MLSPLNDSVLWWTRFWEPLLYNSNNNTIRLAADHPLWFTSWPDGFGAYLYKDETNFMGWHFKGPAAVVFETNLFKTNTALTNVVSNYSGRFLRLRYLW